MKVNSESEVAQLCPTLRDPMDCSPPGSSAHGIFQARVLEWGAIAFSTGRAQSLLNSNISLPFLSVLTGRGGGYSLGSLAGELDPGSAGQRLLSLGSEPAEVAALRPGEELAEEQRLLQDFTWPWIGQ